MIDFSLTFEQEALLTSVRGLMERHAPPEYLRHLDRDAIYPYDLYEQWLSSGLIGLPFPSEFGGQGGSVLDFILVCEEIGRFGYDVASVYGTPIFVALNILHNGSEELRARWLPPFFAGDLRFSVAMTEPGAGSDVGALRTSAVADGDDFVLNGEKIFASGAAVDDNVICVYARTTPPSDESRGITCFLVPKDSPGLDIHLVETLGRHMFPTTQLVFDDVRVPADQIVGSLDHGWEVLLSGLRLERMATSAFYVGNARTVVDEAVSYAKEREQFGRRIGDFQAMAHMLADMQTSVAAARTLMLQAAWKLDTTGDALFEISMSKLFGSEVFAEVANKGMQVLGGYGFSMEFDMQRHYRTARAATVTAGTSQMQRNLVARKLGLRP